MDVSSLRGSTCNSTDSAAARPPGRLLRQEAAEQAQQVRDAFNMALRINYLEEQLLLLKGGEDSTKTEALVELAELRVTLNAREHELRQRTLEFTRVVDDLKAQVEEAKVAGDRAPPSPEEQKKGSCAVASSSTAIKQYQRICLKLRDKLDAMTKQREKSLSDASNLQEQVDKLSTDLRGERKAMRDLKGDYETALHRMYELEAQTWTHRCDQQRVTHEREMLLVREDLQYLKAEKANINEELRQDAEKDLVDLNDRNRVLLEDLRECYRNYTATYRENRNLLKAARIYKSALAIRDDDVRKYTQRLEVSSSLDVARQAVMEQLQETRRLLSATSKRLECNNRIRSEDVQRVADRILQIESVSKRWGWTFAKFQELQQRVADKLSRRYDGSKKQPRWVVDAKQECLSLQVEASILSRTICSLISNPVRLQQLVIDEEVTGTLGSRSNTRVPICHSPKSTDGERLINLSKQLEKVEACILQQTS
uniref:Uncharacterized protein n=1 Tax=Hyaloperonospora arabidopsidis (strain Emoy2) TaxID=559515 RepID=M4B5V7_HYAAE